MSKKYDFLVLGGGSAGYASARTAASHGLSVAIVDGGSELGGLCILRGCMPSKTLIYAAEIAHLAQKGSTLGLDIPSAKVNMAALQARKQKIIGGFAKYRRNQLESERFDLYREQGVFQDSHTIKLTNGETISAEHIMIATGSVVNTPTIPGLKETPFLTSDDILNLTEVPASIIVLGGGVIACELSQFLHRAGAQVTQIQRSSHILKEGTPEAASVVEKAFRDEGIELYTGTKISQIKQYEGKKIEVTFEHNGQTIKKQAEALFNALGRRPNTQKLELANAGVECSPSGHIKTNEAQQTSQPHIYAGGDCAGPHEIVHVAVMQGEIAGNHASGKPFSPVNYSHLSKIIFTDPQTAAVGLTESQAKEQGFDIISAEFPFDDHGKSILMEATYGYVKIIANKKTGVVLGAECVSKDASELIHALIVAIPLQATVFDLLKAHWYHPTLAEIWTYPIEEIAEAITPNS